MGSLCITVPDELFAVAESSSFAGTYDLASLEYSSNEFRFEEPLTYSVQISNTGGALYVVGTVEGDAAVDCVRCLEEARYHLCGEVEGYFLISDSGKELTEEEEDEYEVLPEDHIIDLEPLLRAALVLEMPLSPLCDDDCKGLCPQCGANLNKESCSCEPEESFEPKNPFSVLKTIRFDEE